MKAIKWRSDQAVKAIISASGAAAKKAAWHGSGMAFSAGMAISGMARKRVARQRKR